MTLITPDKLKDGDPYVDEPIVAMPKRLSTAVAVAFRHRAPKPITVGHERVMLRWMKPDGNGGLVPR
jgi:hypothetical protein